MQGRSLFTSELDSEEDIDREELKTQAAELMMSDSLEDRFHYLDIDAELSVSILSGLVHVSGSGKLLEEKRSVSPNASTMGVIYKVETIQEEIDPQDLKKKVDLDVLNTSEVTHVLTGIIWGAVCTFTAHYTFNDNEEKMAIEEALKLEFTKLKEALVDPSTSNKHHDEYEVSLSGSEEKSEPSCHSEVEGSDESILPISQLYLKCTSPNYYFDQFKKDDRIHVYNKCDIDSIGQNPLITFQDSLNELNSIFKLTGTTEEVKGVPLKFIFTPLSKVRRKLRQKIPRDISYQEVDPSLLKQVVNLTQDILDSKLKVTACCEILLEGLECISDSEVIELKDFFGSIVEHETNFKDKLQEVLKSIRSEKTPDSDLVAMIAESARGNLSAKEIERYIATKEPLVQKIREVSKVKQFGIRYFGKAHQIHHGKKDHYVLYLGSTSGNQAITALKILKRLKKSFEKNLETEFYVEDCSVYPKGLSEELINTIRFYKNGSCWASNVAEKYCQDTDSCLVKLQDSVDYDSLPQKRAELVIKCPGSSRPAGCSSKLKEWKCFDCQNPVQYGVNVKKYYCLICKVACNPQTTRYRCDEDEHGIEFNAYNMKDLFEELSKTKPWTRINILILGETGVGKSTWINSFANYINYDTLKSAIEGSKANPIVTIPSKFTFTKDGKTRKVMIGKEDQNEAHEIGESNTQGAKTHPFKIGGAIVNIIDTPGIGDTRGSKQDDENMEKILSHLTYYDELHGIIVLLKPNNARLGIMFKHCIQQLLSHLHRNAAHNISFVFTNTRATFYEPGETLPALEKLLLEKNIGIKAVQENTFCFDNEAFRLLACVLNGIAFEEDVMTIYEGSWSRACNETNRLLQHITTNTRPHVVKDTISLNDSRRIIVGLSRPLQEFSATIKRNEEGVKAFLNEIEALGTEATTFENNLQYEGITLEQHQLDFPRTVCTHSDCIEYIPVGKDMVKQPNYIKHCHVHCNLGGQVSPEVIGDVKLMGCQAIDRNTNNCKQCRHHYTVHMHRTYDLHQVKKQFISDEAQKLINSKLSEKEKKEEQMKSLKVLGEEFKEEGKKIQEVAAGFAAFLKIYAMIPFNDAMGDYIDVQIQQEKEKEDVDGKREDRISEWTKYKAEYEEQKEILIEAMDKVSDTDEGKAEAAKDIKDLMQEAFGLKHFGEDIKKVYKKIEQKKSEMPVFSQGSVQHLKTTSKIEEIKRPTSVMERVINVSKEATKIILKKLGF